MLLFITPKREIKLNFKNYSRIGFKKLKWIMMYKVLHQNEQFFNLYEGSWAQTCIIYSKRTPSVYMYIYIYMNPPLISYSFSFLSSSLYIITKINSFYICEKRKRQSFGSIRLLRVYVTPVYNYIYWKFLGLFVCLALIKFFKRLLGLNFNSNYTQFLIYIECNTKRYFSFLPNSTLYWSVTCWSLVWRSNIQQREWQNYKNLLISFKYF